MFTEVEAKKKWCPMARNWSVETSSGIDQMVCGHNESAPCGASECMMWRWTRDARFTDQTHKLDERLRKSETVKEALDNPPLSSEMNRPKGEGWESVDVPFPQEEGECYWLQDWKRDSDPERTGFCGLAGSLGKL